MTYYRVLQCSLLQNDNSLKNTWVFTGLIYVSSFIVFTLEGTYIGNFFVLLLAIFHLLNVLCSLVPFYKRKNPLKRTASLWVKNGKNSEYNECKLWVIVSKVMFLSSLRYFFLFRFQTSLKPWKNGWVGFPLEIIITDSSNLLLLLVWFQILIWISNE